MSSAGTGPSLSRTLCLVSCLYGGALAAQPSAGPTAGQARRRLVEGNQRYVKGNMKACGASNAAARSTLATEQKPYAIVLACSDSRVPPEIVFDEGLGQLFVIRVAGNVPDPVVLGSIEYAAEHLGSPLLIVLGHERCGAVTAAVDAHGQAPGHLAAIVKAIGPAVTRARSTTQDRSTQAIVEAAVVENAREVAAALPIQSPLLKRLVTEGKLEIVPARYDLDDGTVTMLDRPPVPR
ncbi:MAG TPA: carbonic anhydrase [Polyangia bacterium]|nr:carbonic anhydrase [Polyangia bacterium]